MPDLRKIVIDINLEGSGGSGKTQTAKETKSKAVPKSSKKHGLTSLQSIVVNEAWSVAKSGITQTAGYYVEKYLNITENYIAEQNLSNIITTINKVAGLGVSAIGAGVAGFISAGPAGATIGTIGATLTFVATDITQTIKRIDTARIAQNAINYNVSFSRQRYGFDDNRKGTEN